ncbi:hypothetical protein CONPUDRAFT_148382 [Coniophora puteana RWD-64-598 SS2]|uniref:Uncharacterized protein n=1 Tax=Coniophora puteana (strain RWD-64-598) TaxID=741705 RepID=A0A5M3N4Q9_CONPW|nr:uncharacterized protein CONPUDRAFT_148382 [Coniophora puteana RWD-64-598 SS2]EIW86288.1 hypothetical protein CONPUDRAFT_148382 [Coniophora puteana RWD-64-598 SS2]
MLVNTSGAGTSASAVAGPSGSITIFCLLHEPFKKHEYMDPDARDNDMEGETNQQEEDEEDTNGDEEQPEETNARDQEHVDAVEAAEVNVQLKALARFTDDLLRC